MGLSMCSKLSKILSHHDVYFLKFSTGTSIKLKAKEEDQHEDKFCLSYIVPRSFFWNSNTVLHIIQNNSKAVHYCILWQMPILVAFSNVHIGKTFLIKSEYSYRKFYKPQYSNMQNVLGLKMAVTFSFFSPLYHTLAPPLLPSLLYTSTQTLSCSLHSFYII